MDTPSSAPDSFKIVQAITSSSDECFPPKPPTARKPYISSDTISLIAQLPHTSSTDFKTLRNEIKKSSKLDKKRWISSNLHVDYIGSPSEHWRTIKKVRSKYQPGTQSVNLPDGTPCIRSKKALVLAQHLKDHVWNSLPLPDPIEEPLAPPQPNLCTPFTMFELYRAFRRTKTGRAPGPDNHQWKLFDSSPIPSNAFFFQTTATAYSPELHQTIGSSAKWSWSIKAIKRTAEPPLVVDQFP